MNEVVTSEFGAFETCWHVRSVSLCGAKRTWGKLYSTSVSHNHAASRLSLSAGRLPAHCVMENYQPVLPPGAVKKSIEPSMQDSTPMQSAANAAGVLPAGIHIEQAGPCSVLKAKSLAIVRVNRHLVARKKTGSDPSPRRTERQSCREPTAIGNASRSYDWNWPYGIDHGRNEGHRRDFSTDMATGLPSLCDNDVNTTVYCLTRFNSRADSMKHYGTTRFRTGYEGRRLAISRCAQARARKTR
jgi:hypothetical protein